MKHILLAFALYLSVEARGQSSSDSTKLNPALDARYGFLGNKFDTPFSQFRGLVFIKNYSGYQVYKKAADIKLIGKAKISSVEYSFYKGLLSSVQVKAPNNLENEEAWRELLKLAYGPAQDSVEMKGDEAAETNSYGGNYFWSGSKAGINYSSYLGRDISVYVYSIIAIGRKKIADKAVLTRAAQKL